MLLWLKSFQFGSYIYRVQAWTKVHIVAAVVCVALEQEVCCNLSDGRRREGKGRRKKKITFTFQDLAEMRPPPD